MVRLIELLGKVLTRISVFASMLMAALVVLGVTMRYLVGAPLSFSDEIVGLLFVLIAFTILPACELYGKNITVTLLVDSFPPGVRAVCRVISQILVLVFSVALGLLAWEFAMVSARFNASMASLDFSLVPWILIMPVTLVVLGIVAIVRMFRPGAGEDNQEASL